MCQMISLQKGGTVAILAWMLPTNFPQSFHTRQTGHCILGVAYASLHPLCRASWQVLATTPLDEQHLLFKIVPGRTMCAPSSSRCSRTAPITLPVPLLLPAPIPLFCSLRECRTASTWALFPRDRPGVSWPAAAQRGSKRGAKDSSTDQQ